MVVNGGLTYSLRDSVRSRIDLDWRKFNALANLWNNSEL
jgi:hypothetical protein